MNFLRVLFILAAAVGIATADTVSYTGTLATPESVQDFTVTLASAGMVTLQTYSFGGGTNAAGTNIAAGGMASFLAVFNGTGDSATFVNGTSFDQTNYSSFEGCPPAGAPTIGGSPVCGDITMSLSLNAGTYTVALSDAGYEPLALSETNGTLGDGYVDLTGGSFCNFLINGVDCSTLTPFNNGNYALDITTPGGAPPAVPEPSFVGLMLAQIALVCGWKLLRRRNEVPDKAKP